MGVAIDSIAAFITGAQAALTAATIATGDSATVRSFTAPNAAMLTDIYYQAATLGSVQVSSPMFYETTRGIRFIPGESPVQFPLPPEIGQNLISQDTMSLQMSGGAAGETDVMVLSVYYQNLNGQAARLFQWGDIKGNIKNLKAIEVDVAASATPGQWNDVVITATEDLLHANKDHAILGYILDKPCAAIGIRGQETGNLRVTGPGVVRTLDTSDFFIKKSGALGMPCIPVFNSANKNNTYVTLVEGSAAQAHKVQLVVAELTNNLS